MGQTWNYTERDIFLYANNALTMIKVKQSKIERGNL